MADQGQWFKLWVGADDDPDLGNLSLEDFGRWCRFGIYLKKHGRGGQVVIKEPALPLQQRFRVSSFEEVVSLLKRFPNCHVTEMQDSNVSTETTLTVSFSNWLKYQGDYSTARVRKFREMKRSKRRGEERRGEEKRTETPMESPRDNGWGSPEALVRLYNALKPAESLTVTRLTPARTKKAKAYLATFPREEFWRAVFEEAGRSLLLRGLKPSPGHEHFRFDFDWMLTKGKDGTENVVKVAEGKYRDRQSGPAMRTMARCATCGEHHFTDEPCG